MYLYEVALYLLQYLEMITVHFKKNRTYFKYLLWLFLYEFPKASLLYESEHLCNIY